MDALFQLIFFVCLLGPPALAQLACPNINGFVDLSGAGLKKIDANTFETVRSRFFKYLMFKKKHEQ
jgi:N-acetyl-gamma-glutamylphosphate reductase